MIKYKNITNYRIFLTQDKGLIEIPPQQVVSLSHNPFPGKLVEYYDESKTPVEDEVLEDSIILVSDSIIEELQDEAKKKTTRKRKT